MKAESTKKHQYHQVKNDVQIQRENFEVVENDTHQEYHHSLQLQMLHFVAPLLFSTFGVVIFYSDSGSQVKIIHKTNDEKYSLFFLV